MKMVYVGLMMAAFLAGMALSTKDRMIRWIIAGVETVAFYRLFGRRDEKTVIHVLQVKQHELEQAYFWLDRYRQAEEAADNDYARSIQSHSVAVCQNNVRDARQELDYAIGMAYIMGFGKVATGFKK